MTIIGTFTTSNRGYTGSIITLTLNARACRECVGQGPQFRIFAGAIEIGAAWKKTARDTDRDYLSVKLDDPSFPGPVYASLVESAGSEGFQPIWSRSSREQ